MKIAQDTVMIVMGGVMMTDLIKREDAIEAVHRYFVGEFNNEPYETDEDGDEVFTDMKSVNKLLAHNKAVSRAIKALPSAEAEWIPCSERLPEVGEICLLTVHEYGWNCKEYTRVIIGEYSDNYADHILAWMPLPKPYKGGDTE